MLPILDPVHSSCSLRCSFTVDFSPTEQCLPASLIMVSLYVSSCILLLLFSILSSILLVSLVSMWFAVNCVLALRKSACLSWWQVCFHSYLFWSVAIWCFLLCPFWKHYNHVFFLIQIFQIHIYTVVGIPGLKRVMPQPPPPAPVSLLWSPLANVTLQSVSRAVCPTPITFKWCWLISMSSCKWWHSYQKQPLLLAKELMLNVFSLKTKHV